MNSRVDVAYMIGLGCGVVLAAIIAYQIMLYRARKAQRGMSTRQRLKFPHWTIRIDDALKKRQMARSRASEKRKIVKQLRRRSRN